ncbi:hypothetical protein I3843_14G115800 [Carya illinoinensis]|nr:hypothetical protein I3843_14G115800 [Carya illinoinensis]
MEKLPLEKIRDEKNQSSHGIIGPVIKEMPRKAQSSHVLISWKLPSEKIRDDNQVQEKFQFHLVKRHNFHSTPTTFTADEQSLFVISM